MLRVIDELLWTLRREGFAIAPPQAIDAAKVVAAVGFDDRAILRDAIGCVVVTSAKERRRYVDLFDRFFAGREPRPRDLWARLSEEGFGDAELEALRELLEAAANAGGATAIEALAKGGGELDRLLAAADIRRVIDPMTNALQAGFYAQRVLDRVGLSRTGDLLRRLGERLRDAIGEERAKRMVEVLTSELDRARARVREHVDEALRRRIAEPELSAEKSKRRLAQTPFVSLNDAELEEVKLAVRAFAERLRGAARVRERHARRGRIDPHRTVRQSLRTGGIPFRPARRDRRRDRPRLVVLCDVSDSVRTAARFMLEFVYAVQELFDRTRSFVFVSELGEVTALFEREKVHTAMSMAYGGHVVNVSDNSSYGRVFRAFEERYMHALDRRTTVVILGDGRTNYRPDGADVVGRMRERARSVLWLCPETRGGWGVGDSAMPVYATKVDQVLEVRTAEDLERAARRLLARG